MNEWREQERRLESELSRLKVEVTSGQRIDCAKRFLNSLTGRIFCILRGTTQNALSC